MPNITCCDISFTIKKCKGIQTLSLQMFTSVTLYGVVSALLLAALKVCVVCSQYFKGIKPSFIQLRSAPLSTSAIKS